MFGERAASSEGGVAGCAAPVSVNTVYCLKRSLYNSDSMPTYEYRCLKCKKKFDYTQSMTEKPLKKCIRCGGKVERLIGSGAGLVFKGSGFYATDYKKQKTEVGNQKTEGQKQKTEAVSEKKTEQKKEKKDAGD